MRKIERLTRHFRNALDAAWRDGMFRKLYPFNNFPNDCCGHACDLLSQYLIEHGIETKQVVGKGGSMTISGQQYPRELVKSRFLKLNMSHVEYVMECLRKNTTKVYNIKAYLLASLFNAGTTMSNYYRAEVNHDMPQFAG